MTRPPFPILVARAALAVGSLAGLCWLAPLENATGVWLGLGSLAFVVPALIDSYVVLSVLTSMDRRWSLPIAMLSGGVGQLHAASVLVDTSATTRAVVATLAVALAVVVTARLKPLVQRVVTAVRAEEDAARAAQLAHEESLRAAERAESEMAHRRTQEVEEMAHRRALERTAQDAELARAHTAPAHGVTARADEEESAPAHEEESHGARSRRTTAARRQAVTARKAAARSAQSADDVQRRRRARDEFEASVRAGAPMDNATLARALFGIDEPDSKQLRAASARASEWRRALEAERTDEDATAADGAPEPVPAAR